MERSGPCENMGGRETEGGKLSGFLPTLRKRSRFIACDIPEWREMQDIDAKTNEVLLKAESQTDAGEVVL